MGSGTITLRVLKPDPMPGRTGGTPIPTERQIHGPAGTLVPTCAQYARDQRQQVYPCSSASWPAFQLIFPPCPRAHVPACQLTSSIPNSGVIYNNVVGVRIRFGLMFWADREGYHLSEITNAEHLSSGHLIEPKTA
jgi:hypothetical protein